tara:strand:- start:5093 stop:5350 length:258 start_codon:yes stop_codon:yes gene_type:complete
LPINQYGTTKVNRNIINQKPIVKIVRKAKKPKYWSNSNIFTPFVLTKILSSYQKKQIQGEKNVFIPINYQINTLYPTFVIQNFKL